MKPNYGIDAPGVVLRLGLGGAGAFIAGFIFRAALAEQLPNLTRSIFHAGFFSGRSCMATAAVMVLGSTA